MAAKINEIREPHEAMLREEVGRTETLLYRRGNFNGTLDDVICDALLAERDAEIALSPGFRWGDSLLPGQAITREDVYNATAMTYPAAYRMTMTGARLKEILEDVADNLFNPDPYYQQGGDMVRVGGLAYTIEVGKPMGSRISDLRVLRTGQPLEAGQGIRCCRLGERQRGNTKGPPIWDVVFEHHAKEKAWSRRARPSTSAWSAPEFGEACDALASDRAELTIEQLSRRGSCAAASPRRAPALRAEPLWRAAAGNPANQPPNVPDWSRYLGEGVAVRAYGKPSQHEAHVVRRDVEWLTASRRARSASRRCTNSTASITPNGLCFERHHAGIAEIDPADYRLILHGLVDKPLIFTLDDLKRYAARQPRLLLRMRGEFRHGMARRAAQRLPIHARHGPLRDVHRRAAEGPARGGRAEAQRQMAPARRRRRRRYDALAAAARRRWTTRSSPTA